MLEPRGWHARGYLPHFDDGASLQAISYRLADAMPAKVLLKMAEQALDGEKRRAEIECYLDAGHGCCALRQPVCAEAVVESWRHFDGTRYSLHAWAVMPNHVHVLIGPLGGASISEIVQSWKSYTAKLILRSVGPASFAGNRVWQPDYFDRFIRNEQHYAATVDYIHQNPVAARLAAHAEDWPWSSASEWECAQRTRL